MRLYDIAQEYKQILDLVEAGDLTAEMVSDTLESINAEFETKALNCMMVVAQLDSDSEGIGKQIDRLKALQKSIDGSRENLVDYVKEQMISTSKDKLDLGLFKLTLRAATKAVNVIDETKLDAKYFRIIPESKAVDKATLAAALKLGEVEGAELVDGKRALMIK